MGSGNIQLPDEVYELGIGETANGLVCPVCNGGYHRDKSFSCTRVEGGFVYLCFRASCHERGFTARNSSYVQDHSRTSRPPTPVRQYKRPIESTPSEVVTLVRERYHITATTLEHFRVGWSPPQDDRVGRLVIPVLRPDGSEGGLVVRAIHPTTEPKSLTYIPRPGCMSWFLGRQDVVSGQQRTAWVVEDQFSAMRLWQEGLSAVALLGTHINHERAVEISSVSSDVFLALDKDATAKSIGYAAQFRYAFNAKVVALSKDIKDMGQEELKEFLNNDTD